MEKITLIGAGLAGSLLAIILAQKGYQIDVFEKRPDMRKTPIPAGKSINLALSHRGINALKAVGIADKILQEAIPMYGRMLHDKEGNLTFLQYGKDKSEYINSVSRWGLNVSLMNLAEDFSNIKLHFNQECTGIDLDKNTITLKNNQTGVESTQTAEIIIGTDGAGSAVRQCLAKEIDFKESTEFLAHGYKELNIPPLADGKFAIEKNALHIWPRGTYMLIALPNLDGSFTCTLFFPNTGEISFETLNTEQKVADFFSTYFADTLPLIPQLTQEFLHNPLGLLGTVKCYPWHYKNKLLLLGDAAHAIVPFYGQGMNASFEDCVCLSELVEMYPRDWQKIFEIFSQKRKPNTDAIADLAVENFYEMRDGVANAVFQQVRKLEFLLENQYPDYHSKYSMVTFHPEIPYSEAQKRGNWQNNLLSRICEQNTKVEEINLAEVYEALQQYEN